MSTETCVPVSLEWLEWYIYIYIETIPQAKLPQEHERPSDAQDHDQNGVKHASQAAKRRGVSRRMK